MIDNYNIPAELISIDNRKVYKDLTIGQMVLFPQYREKIPLHMTKFLSLDQKISLAEYKKRVEQHIDKIHNKGGVPILVGGDELLQLSILQNWQADQSYQVHPPQYKFLIFVTKTAPAILYRQIHKHVDDNFRKGLFAEVKHLVNKYQLQPHRRKQTTNVLWRTIEYREFLEYALSQRKPLDKFNSQDLKRVKKGIFIDLKELARKQIRSLKKFPSYRSVRRQAKAQEIMKKFLQLD